MKGLYIKPRYSKPLKYGSLFAVILSAGIYGWVQFPALTANAAVTTVSNCIVATTDSLNKLPAGSTNVTVKTPAAALATDVVCIPDSSLKAKLSSNANVTAGELKAKTGILSLSSSAIESLIGIEYATTVVDLSIFNNSISDITPIQGLTNLTNLHFGKNQVTDISSLASLTNLTDLYIFNNQIANLAPLQTLTNLRTLSVGDASTTSFAPISTLTGLTKLYVGGSKVTDLSWVTPLKNITSFDLWNNPVSSLVPLQSLPVLAYLDLDKSQITDISALAPITTLVDIRLEENQVSDITPLRNLTNLTSLDLYDNQVSDISAVKNLTNLTNLTLWKNQVSNVTAVQYLTKLATLDLEENKIADITPLYNLTNLTKLYLSNNAPEIRTVAKILSNPLTINSGTKLPITSNATIANSGANLQLLDPAIAGKVDATYMADFSTPITIGGASTTFSGKLKVIANIPSYKQTIPLNPNPASQGDAIVKNTTLSITAPDCGFLSDAKSIDASGLDTATRTSLGIIGGFSFTIKCSATQNTPIKVTAALGTTTTNLKDLRFYKQIKGVMKDITSQVSLIENNGVITADYYLLDGGEFDEDGVKNGEIVDPIYVGVVQANATTLAQTGTNTALIAGSAVMAIVIGVVLVRRVR